MATDHIHIEDWVPDVPTCPECGGPPDERVDAGMKCARCAYPSEEGGVN